MKHRLLFVLSYFFLLKIAAGQTYVPFPTGDASWKVIRCFYFYPPDGYDLFTYSQSGDTIMGGLSYHKIYVSNHHLPGSIYDTTYVNYYGAIREEQKKIWINSEYAFGDNLDRLAYDFNAQNVGDTITTNLLNYGDPITVKNIIGGIDSVLIDGTYHRRLKLNTIDGNPTLENWIEGIGSNFGLVYASFYLITDNSYDLRCFSSEGISYQNNQLLLSYCQLIPPVNCDFATPVVNVKQPNHVSIFPNPVNDVLHIHFAVSFGSGTNIILYSSVGQLLVRKDISSETDLDLNVSKFPAGTYWVKLESGNGLRETMPVIKE